MENADTKAGGCAGKVRSSAGGNGKGFTYIQQSTAWGMDVPWDAQGWSLPLSWGLHQDLHTTMPSATQGCSESLAVALTPPQLGDEDCCRKGPRGLKQQGKMLCAFPCRAVAGASLS